MVKEIEVKSDMDILHLELIEALGLLTIETISNGYECGEMIIEKLDSNHGSFKYTITCEKVTEKVGVLDKIKGWFK